MFIILVMVALAPSSKPPSAPPREPARATVRIERAAPVDEQTWRDYPRERRREIVRVEADGRLTKIRVIEHE